jgi:uncharacterized protein
MNRLLALSVLLASTGFGADGGAKAPSFVPVEVLDVIDADEGFAVLLLQRQQHLVLPIFVGPVEALAIRQRLEKQHPVRPMTHDLLEDVITGLGSKLLRVEIDDLKANTFLGRLVLEQQKRVITLDARPSDSIAIALGLGAPILVSQAVLQRAGVPQDVPPAPKGPKTETL